MKFQILTIFPEFFDNFSKVSIVGRAVSKKIIEIEPIDIRIFSKNKHKKVDDVPFGGNSGMIFQCQPIFDAIEFCQNSSNNPAPVIFFTPSEFIFDQKMAEDFSSGIFPQIFHDSSSKKLYKKNFLNKKCDRLILLCGRYEGVDFRIRDQLVDAEISIGNFIVSGGELPAQIFIDAITRLLPGALGNEKSCDTESFSKVLGREKIEYPQYTRPADFRGMKVPEVLLSGHHAEIEKWQLEHCKNIGKISKIWKNHA